MTTQRFDLVTITYAQLLGATGGIREMGLQNLQDQVAGQKNRPSECPVLQNLSSTWII